MAQDKDVIMSRGPGTAQGYYRGDTFLYRVKCYNLVQVGGSQVNVSCEWVGYRVWPNWGPCPRCGGPIR
jgi:hypothetical protein